MTVQLTSIFVGGALLAFIWWLGLRRLSTWKHALITDGTIIDMIPVQSASELGDISHVPQIRFRAHDGTEHVVTRVYSSSTLFKPEFRVGQIVRIAYDPKTYNAEILKPRRTFNLLATLFVFTLLILGILFVLIAG